MLVSQSCPTATPWTVACQAPLSMEFSRQEYWGGLPFPSPGDLPNPRIKPGSPALQADSLPPEPPGKLLCDLGQVFIHSSVDRHLNYLYFLSITNNAAMNIHVEGFVWTYVFIFLGFIPRSGIAGSYAKSIFTLL